ncbi:MAG: glycosyltransferase family 2 protein [Elusimicrobiaceae bacterium]|nr:glycosyltransferase family 2 protein [Elusimicrobiaceae bacterium]
MPNPCISIIVPVYNTEKYLRTCLESIRTQTFQDFEVLVVNNDSPDHAQTIIDEFAAKDPRFTPLFRKGGRAGGARNTALAQARGEYVLFVDSDDWIAPTLCEHLHTTAQRYHLDIVDSAGINVNEDGIALKPRTASSYPPPAHLRAPRAK